jgi:hypothetical protein
MASRRCGDRGKGLCWEGDKCLAQDIMLERRWIDSDTPRL